MNKFKISVSTCLSINCILECVVDTLKLLNSHLVCFCTSGADSSQAVHQQSANVPLLPPPKQPTLASLAGQGSQAAAAKPKSKKVCVLLCYCLFEFLLFSLMEIQTENQRNS